MLFSQLGQTALHYAVEEDRPLIVKLLLKYGADPHAVSIGATLT